MLTAASRWWGISLYSGCGGQARRQGVIVCLPLQGIRRYLEGYNVVATKFLPPATGDAACSALPLAPPSGGDRGRLTDGKDVLTATIVAA